MAILQGLGTAFTPILRRAVERVPGAFGAIFADADGEAVDQVSLQKIDDMKVVGAHYGIILHHVQSVLHLFHFGEAEEIVLLHDDMDLLVHAVRDGYFLLLAAKTVHLGSALREVRDAALKLAQNM